MFLIYNLKTQMKQLEILKIYLDFFLVLRITVILHFSTHAHKKNYTFKE